VKSTSPASAAIQRGGVSGHRDTEGRGGCVGRIPEGGTIVENSPRSSREKYIPRERYNTEGRGG